MYMESHLGLILEHSWNFVMDPLMVLIMTSLRYYCLGDNWYLLMVKCLAMMKALNWYLLLVNWFSLYLELCM